MERKCSHIVYNRIKKEQINERNMVEYNDNRTKRDNERKRIERNIHIYIYVLEQLLYIVGKMLWKSGGISHFKPIPTHEIVLSIQIGSKEQSSQTVLEVHYGYCICKISHSWFNISVTQHCWMLNSELVFFYASQYLSDYMVQKMVPLSWSNCFHVLSIHTFQLQAHRSHRTSGNLLCVPF